MYSAYKLNNQGDNIQHCHCCSITQSCPTLCDPMVCNTPGFAILHYLSEFAQTHVHWVSDAIQSSHPVSPPFSSCPQFFPSIRSLPMSQLFMTPWNAACQAFLSFTISWSLLRLMFVESVMQSISSSVTLFFCFQPYPASGSFSVSRLFASSGQGIGASASVLPMNIQSWFPLGLTGLIFLLSKRLSRVFSRNTVRKHWFFSAQPSLWSNSHIHTWLLEKP